MTDETASGTSKNKGGRPRRKIDVKALAEMPEVQAMIQAAVSHAMSSGAEELLAKLTASRIEGGASHQVAAGDPEWASRLAVALDQVANPGKKAIEPAVIVAREQARARMQNLLIEARARGVIPEYELRTAVYLEERLIYPTYVGMDRVLRPTMIGWAQVPSEAMTPVNDVAREIFTAFLESIGGKTTAGVRPDQERAGNLHVMSDGKLQSIPQVRAQREGSGDLRILGRQQPGQVVETRVLGTVAQPARQLA